MLMNNTVFDLCDIPYISAKQGIVFDVGDAFEDLTGYHKEDLLKKPVNEVFCHNLRATFDVSCNLSDDIDELCGFIFTKAFEAKEVIVSPKKLQEDGRIIIRVIEKRNSSLEYKFPMADVMFRHNIIGVGIFCVEPNIVLLKANQTYLDFFGEPYNSKENAIGKRIDEFVKGWRGSTSETIWKNLLLTGEPFNIDEYPYEWPDRGMCYYQGSLIPIREEGNIKYVVETTVDITDSVCSRKRIEEQARIIKQKNEELEAIIENMSDGLAVFDSSGAYIKVNKTVKGFFGSNDIKRVGDGQKTMKYLDVGGEEYTAENMPFNRILKGENVRDSIIHIKSEEDDFYIGVNGVPVFNEDGSLRLGIICTNNITRQIKQSETIRKQNEVLEKSIKMKDEFLATITHEFKTPLTVINAAVQAINTLYGKELSDNVRQHIQRIRINSFRQLRLVNNLLDITSYNAGHIKIQKQNLDIVFLTQAITRSVQPFAAQKEVKLVFSTEVESMTIAIDEEKYERILLNLLSNAIKFIPRGKSIYINVSRKDKNAVVSVRDEGVGIPANKQKLIFERFGQVDNVLTRQAEGSGIGLSLVKSLVNAMGGNISLESKVGKGSTFSISLPVKKARQKQNSQNIIGSTDARIMQAAAIEFSDIYLE